MAIKLKTHEFTVRIPGRNEFLKFQKLRKLGNFNMENTCVCRSSDAQLAETWKSFVWLLLQFLSVFLLHIKAQPKWKFCI